MDPILTALRTTATAKHLTVSNAPQEPLSIPCQDIDNPENALKALKSKPDSALLTSVLCWLNSHHTGKEDQFKIKAPGPKTAQIINVLVSTTLIDYWGSLLDPKLKRLFIECLSSVTGLNAIILNIRLIVAPEHYGRGQINSEPKKAVEPLGTYLNVVSHILEKDDFVLRGWTDTLFVETRKTPSHMLWKEFISTVASGRLLSVAAEAIDALKKSNLSNEEDHWVGDGFQYSSWLSRNIAVMAINLPVLENSVSYTGWKALAQFTSKALTLGYSDKIKSILYKDLLLSKKGSFSRFQTLLQQLVGHEQRSIINSVISLASKQSVSSSCATVGESKVKAETHAVCWAAAVIFNVVENDLRASDTLYEWLTSTSGGCIGQDHIARRAVIRVMAMDQERVKSAFQRVLRLFGDKIYIKHTPILHQEVNTEVLLLLAGYCHRSDASYIPGVSKSSVYLKAISSRLAASSQRARFLGMVVGEAISKITDPPNKRLTFSSEEASNEDRQWYCGLVEVQDRIGSIEDIQTGRGDDDLKATQRNNVKGVKDSKKFKSVSVDSSKPPPTSRIVSIEEIESDGESEDEDLLMYEKPDSDAEDEDEDATLVQHKKPTAPVYIRDLIAGLRDTENFDRHRLALTTASNLIRRKASFGTEVLDHIEELATLLVGLGDKYDIEGFQQLRLQGMIAVLIAKPLAMGPWFSKTFFNGDYSMSQRASILTTLGLGARELAGFREEDAALTGTTSAPESSFPSKKLPQKLHKLYALEAAPVDALAKKMERTMIQPMAAKAADQLAGPDVLKVRTFSSRMKVEEKRKKPIPNELAKIVASGFFFPLTGLWRIQLQAYGEKSVQFSSFLLTSFLKTLSLILHASGASTLSLPQMTAEFWDLLLSLRSGPARDSTVLEALLFAFLTLLDVNEDKRRIVEDHPKELIETQRWVEQVFQDTGGGSEEGERVRMLAAGVLVRTREVVEKYHRALMGNVYLM